MISGNDNNRQRNSGRLQSSPLNVEQIKKQIEEGMKKEMGKKAKSGSLKNTTESKPTHNELRRQNKLHPREGSKESQIREIREESRREVEKQITKKASEQIKDRKTRMVMKVAGERLDAVACAIAQKMAEETKKGGIHAVIPITMTYLLALGKDLFDFTGVGAVIGIISGILVGTIIALFWVQVSGGWKGGYIQKKLIKKIIIKIGLAAFIETLPGPNLIPTFIIMNLWSHLDFVKSNKKAKNDYKKFINEYKTKRGKYITG